MSTSFAGAEPPREFGSERERTESCWAAGAPGWARWAASRLFSTSAFLLAARLLGAAAGFGVQLLLARYLAPQDLGIYFTATSLTVIGGVIAAHGYPSIATRFLSRYRRPSGASLLSAFVRRAQVETLILALALTVLVAGAAGTWPDVSAEARSAVVLAAITIPFAACFRLYGSLAAATRSFSLAYLPDVCLKPVLVLAASAAIVIARHDLTLFQAMLILAAATVVLSLAQITMLARHFSVPLRLWGDGNQPRPASVKPLAARWRREAHAVLLVAVFSQFFPDVSILIAMPVLSAAEMGTFGLCLKLAFLVGFFVMVTQNIATPDLADALGKRGEGSGSTLASSCSAPTLVTLAALVIFILWGPHMLALFGQDFVAGHAALVLLVAAQLVRAVFGPTNAVLTLLGEQKTNLQITALAVLMLAVSTAALGTLFGLDGVALAVLLTTLFWSAASAYMLQRKAGVRVDLLAALARPA